MTRLVHYLLGLDGVVVYLIVGLLVFAEDALFVGFVVPGETAAIIGGVAASRGRVSLTLMCAVVVVAAVLADSVGYYLGARYGTRLLSLRMLRRRKQGIDAARAALARRGGVAVFLGRFVTFFHAVMPFLAGASRMPYRRFLAYNVAGGLVWGIGAVLLGFLAGNSYAAIQKTFGRTAAIGVAVLVVIGLVTWRVRQHRRRRAAQPDEPPGG